MKGGGGFDFGCFLPLLGKGGKHVDPVYCLYETILMSESVPVEGDAVESEFNVYMLLDFPPFRCSPPSPNS